MRGKLPTEDQNKKVYDQEYREVIARIVNTLDLTDESPSFSMVPTSLMNPDIVLPHKLFRECRGLPEIPSGQNPEPREYEMDRAWGLVDLDWLQHTPIFHLDDIDRDPRFSQYPFQEGDDYEDDDEEDMEVVMPPWHCRLIPGIPINAYRRLTLLNLLRLRVRPRAHTLIPTLQWKWEV